MAKKIYGIADAMRSEVKTQEPDKVEVQKEAKKRGRPRKNPVITE